VIVARADASQRVGESSHRHQPPFTTAWRAPSPRSDTSRADYVVCCGRPLLEFCEQVRAVRDRG
jgi:hypothetical protein